MGRKEREISRLISRQLCAVTHVVDDELRDELAEAEPLQETRHGLDHERVRRAVLLVEERVDGPAA